MAKIEVVELGCAVGAGASPPLPAAVVVAA